jgi:hypothetical protein
MLVNGAAFVVIALELEDTRSAARQTYYLPSIRTNYGKFNVRFLGPQFWNSLEDNIKNFSLERFKNHLKNEYLSKY